MVMAKGEKFQRSLSLPSQYILPTMPTSLKKRRNGLGYIFYGQQPVDVQLILSQLKFARTASYCFRMNAPFCNQQTSQLTLLTELSSYVDADNNDDILNEIIDDVDVDSDGFESMSSVTGESYPAESESRPHCVFYISDCNSPITLPTTKTTTATPRQKEDLETVVSQQTVTSAAASHSHIAQHLSTQTAESYDNTSTLPVNVTGDSSQVHQAKRSDMGRRNALADIFSGIPEDKVVDFLSEYSFCEKAVTTSDEIYLSDSLENCKSGIEDSCTVSACETVLVDLDLDLNMRKNGLSQLPRNRRRAMADIFDGIHEQDRQRLFELHETLPSDEERDILASERRHSRRHALGDIFSHTSADELSRLRSEYSR